MISLKIVTSMQVVNKMRFCLSTGDGNCFYASKPLIRFDSHAQQGYILINFQAYKQ
jgi:hypothetical protein